MYRQSCAILGTIGLVASGAACKHVPSAGFRSLELHSIQPDINRKALRMELVLQLAVRSGEKVPLLIPAHAYKLRLGDVWLDSGDRAELKLEPGAFQVLDYPFTIDLGSERLAPLAGKVVPLTFDLELKLRREGGGAPEEAVNTVLDKLQAGTLRFHHETLIRLPKPPEVRPAPPGTGLAVSLIQPPIGSASPLDPLAQADLKIIEDALQKLRAGASFDPICGFCSANFSFSAPRSFSVKWEWGDCEHNSCQLVVAGSRVCRADTFCPPGFRKEPSNGCNTPHRCVPETAVWSGLGQLEAFLTKLKSLQKNLATLAKSPGIRIVLPIRLYNPNAFPLSQPRFSMKLWGAEGSAELARLSFLAQGRGRDWPEGDPRRCPAGDSTCIPGETETTAQLEVLLYWSRLRDGGLMGLVDSGGPLPVPRVEGEVSVDLGFGRLILPLGR